jgi:predicted dehydrogenase
MIRVGMVGFDTSHTVGFARCMNHKDCAEEHWVDGAQVVAGLPTEPSPSRAEDAKKYMEQVAATGVVFVDSAGELLNRVDAILLECVDGHVHLDQIQPFVGKGKPIFVDKPFAGTADQARQIAELAERTKTPLFSASSMRYAPQIKEFIASAETHGELFTLISHGQCEGMKGSAMTPLIYYGVHAAEALYAIMGVGCKEVSCYSTGVADFATGVWSDGRTGCVLGTRRSKGMWGFTAYCRKVVEHHTLDISHVEKELLAQVVRFFQTRQSPVPLRETVECIAFLDAAGKSAQQGSKVIALET